jgi:glycosyltransferase involved in cell wall biosynthesis
MRPSLFLGGLAKNCESSLLSNIPSLLSLRKNFECSGVILEDGSKDNTRAILQAFAGQFQNIKVITPDVQSGLQRYDKMAYLRNVILDEARKVNPDFLCMADLDLFHFDGLDSYVPSKGMVADTTFGLMPYQLVSGWHPSKEIQWRGVSWVYYDLLAVEFSDGTRPHWLGDVSYPDTKEDFLRAKCSSISSPMTVNSAYGGMAFYRYSAIKDLQYEGGDCEHIKFHKKLNGVRIIDSIRGIYHPPVLPVVKEEALKHLKTAQKAPLKGS